MPKPIDTPYRASPLTKRSPGDNTIMENVPGEDTKKIGGRDKSIGHHSNEGDQCIEDAKKARH